MTIKVDYRREDGLRARLLIDDDDRWPDVLRTVMTHFPLPPLPEAEAEAERIRLAEMDARWAAEKEAAKPQRKPKRGAA